MATHYVIIRRAGNSLKVDDAVLSDEIYGEIVHLGYEVYLNRGMSKLIPARLVNDENRKTVQAEAMNIAKANWNKLVDGSAFKHNPGSRRQP